MTKLVPGCPKDFQNGLRKKTCTCRYFKYSYSSKYNRRITIFSSFQNHQPSEMQRPSWPARRVAGDRRCVGQTPSFLKRDPRIPMSGRVK